jgi:hypothetical protein
MPVRRRSSGSGIPLLLSARSARRKHCLTSSNAGCSEHQATDFTVIHPFHPGFGQRHELVERRNNWGEDRVNFYDAEGELRSMPTAWTDLGEFHLFVTATAGRSWFRVADLLDLVRLLNALQQRVKGADHV